MQHDCRISKPKKGRQFFIAACTPLKGYNLFYINEVSSTVAHYTKLSQGCDSLGKGAPS